MVRMRSPCVGSERCFSLLATDRWTKVWRRGHRHFYLLLCSPTAAARIQLSSHSQFRACSYLHDIQYLYQYFCDHPHPLTHHVPPARHRSLQSLRRHALPKVFEERPLQLRMQGDRPGTSLSVPPVTHTAAPQPQAEAEAHDPSARRPAAQEGCRR
jgi:hypothetical protein